MFDSRPQYTPAMMVIAHAYYFIHGQKFARHVRGVLSRPLAE